jgi:hypothetical protein
MSDYMEDGIAIGSSDFNHRICLYAQVRSVSPLLAAVRRPQRAQALRTLIAFCFFYPLSFAGYNVAAMLALDRLMIFSKLKGPPAKSFWGLWLRVVITVVIIGAGVSVSCNIAASVFFVRAANIFDDIWYAKANATRRFEATEQNLNASRASAFMFAYEALLLPAIIASFLAVGVAGSRRIRLAMQPAGENTPAIKRLPASIVSQPCEPPERIMRQLAGTCAVIFLSLCARAAPAVMYAVAAGLQNSNVACGNYTNRCSECYNTYTHMFVWIMYNPSIYFAVLLASQPFALLVALWGMTSQQTLDLMKPDLQRSSVEMAA